MRPVLSQGILWTLEKNGKTAQDLVHEIQDVGLELRYLWNGELMMSRVFRSGPELLAEATEKRFELEGRGWRLVPVIT